jgi:hypothetical protein
LRPTKDKRMFSPFTNEAGRWPLALRRPTDAAVRRPPDDETALAALRAIRSRPT